MLYTAGWNTPGHMPDSVDEFEYLEEAVAFLANEIEFRWDGDYWSLNDPPSGDEMDAVDAKYLDIHTALHNIGNDFHGTFTSWEHECGGELFFITTMWS